MRKRQESKQQRFLIRVTGWLGTPVPVLGDVGEEIGLKQEANEQVELELNENFGGTTQ